MIQWLRRLILSGRQSESIPLQPSAVWILVLILTLAATGTLTPTRSMQSWLLSMKSVISESMTTSMSLLAMDMAYVSWMRLTAIFGKTSRPAPCLCSRQRDWLAPKPAVIALKNISVYWLELCGWRFALIDLCGRATRRRHCPRRFPGNSCGIPLSSCGDKLDIVACQALIG